ncbi:MAG TPA: DUF1851 domain-containing protein [Opitutaceae bacterium]|nr:DUF1851 domain-containing protein [Opitutaceae bacterium]HOR25435.1 DUF1851 domain-containing protein [Opitutaceae bacterium]HPK49082.1 DUF1851 domain-containing protein [Opitutaceae bacterium]
MKDVRDYLIDQTGLDFQRMFENWSWRLSGSFTVWLITRFGDLFITQDDGGVWWLRLDDGSYTRVAASKEEFLSQIDDGAANDRLMIPLVDRLVAAGKALKEKECYAFVQLPILGGDYVVENVVVRDLAFQYAALGPVFEKIKDLPDGAQFSFRIENQEDAHPGGTDNSGAAPRRV